ncbi:hypothetical protein SARC_05506 [Sphaeroforma arctica JP610]|uniref:NADH:ubiquinone oxidoreductase intermediate-associated protein 30 domain-containing protein n=1 Tax=Sphaeroforma arctica JP610 TaxID=667725 RepID=A0A0L0G1Y7_9EUKA|nr:hypothetical protein SARC_05506 [Sphaeroforma arctica JP610]KNC82208.1 hypothetical protein SARC_05506 [Sphaeroforma arctica JP610]|eukprot:XP_014156110.1 hypothetical protein SARC_05506 [Sphaeroforma arctica JP610]
MSESRLTWLSGEIATSCRLFSFRNSTDLSKWVVTSDASMGGFSKAEKVLSARESVLFRGTLSTAVPATMKNSGYCALRSKPLADKSELFKIRGNHDLSDFDSLEIRLRGDGRAYAVNIQTDGIQEQDLYQTFLYTKGGPDWETVRLPLRDFALTFRGFMQNHQVVLNASNVRTIGFLLADRLDGPFNLEIDYINATSWDKCYSRLDTYRRPTILDFARKQQGGW